MMDMTRLVKIFDDVKIPAEEARSVIDFKIACILKGCHALEHYESVH